MSPGCRSQYTPFKTVLLNFLRNARWIESERFEIVLNRLRHKNSESPHLSGPTKLYK